MSGGADIEVNASNVHDYVRRYAEYRMVKVTERALEVSQACISMVTSLLYISK